MIHFFSGLLLFFVLHIATATPTLRRAVVGRIGETPWRGAVAIGSLAAIGLMAGGWAAAPNDMLFGPVTLVVAASPFLVGFALILFVIGAANLKAHLRRKLHHPMLAGVALWALTHLLANGGLRETLLFGSFLLFSLYAYVTLLGAGKRAEFVPAWKWDAIGAAIGITAAIGVIHGHRWLFGVAVP